MNSSIPGGTTENQAVTFKVTAFSFKTDSFWTKNTPIF